VDFNQSKALGGQQKSIIARTIDRQSVRLAEAFVAFKSSSVSVSTSSFGSSSSAKAFEAS